MVAPTKVFIGRELQLEQLGAWLGPPHLGRLLLVAGEAGVGKSRLVTEAVAGLDSRVAWAACWEGDGAPAFWPWVQVIRACLGTPGGNAWRLADTPSVGEVMALLPERGVPSLLLTTASLRTGAGRANPPHR